MSSSSIKISLVICTYNRDKYLPEALESIRSQTLERENFELIIVDNNSTDNTASIAKKFIADNPLLKIRYCFEPNKGLSFARNRGVKEAHGEIISYVDDDAILSPDFLKAMLFFFEKEPEAVGAGGKVIPKYETGSAPAWMNKYLNGFVGKMDYGEEIKRFNKNMKYPAGCNMTYTKDILLKAGGFNNDLTFRSDDKYIFYHVKKFSDAVFYVPDAYVYHYIDAHRLTKENFRKLFLKTGNEEKKRIKAEEGTIGLVKKLIEYFLKLAASLVIYFIFAVKGESIKGRYVLYAQWFTLKGFIMKEVFVR